MKSKKLWILFSCLFAALLLVAALPPILSTGWVKETLILPYINERVPGQLKVQSIKADWLNGVEFKQCSYTANDVSMGLQSIQIKKPLWSLLVSQSTPPFNLEKLELNLGADGQLLLDECHFIEDLTIKGSATYHSDVSKISLEHGIGEIQQFPVPILSAIYQHFVPSCEPYQWEKWLGNLLNLKIKKDDSSVSFSLSSSEIQAKGTGTLTDQFLISNSPIEIEWKYPGIETKIHLTLSELKVPHSGDRNAYTLKGKILVDDLQVSDQVRTEELKGNFQYDQVQQLLAFSFNGTVRESQERTPLRCLGTIAPFHPLLPFSVSSSWKNIPIKRWLAASGYYTDGWLGESCSGNGEIHGDLRAATLTSELSSTFFNQPTNVKLELVEHLGTTECSYPRSLSIECKNVRGTSRIQASKLAGMDEKWEGSVSLQYQLTSHDFNPFLNNWTGETSLLGNSQLDFNCPHFFISMSDGAIVANGKLELDQLLLGTSEGAWLGGVKDAHSNWDFDTAKKTGGLSLKALTTHKNAKEHGKISATAAFDSPTLLGFDLSIDQLPITIMNSLLGEHTLSALIGEEISLSGEGNFSLDDPENRHFSLKVIGDEFDLQGKVHLGQTISTFDPGEPLICHWKLSPTRFQSLRKLSKQQNLVTLNESTEVIGSIKQLSLPWFSSEENSVERALGFYHMSGSASLSASPFSLFDEKRGERIKLSDLHATFNTDDLSNGFLFSGNIHGEMQENSPTSTEFVVNCSHLFGQKSISADLYMKTVDAPLSLYCELAGLNSRITSQLYALIGSKMNSEVKASLEEMRGPVAIGIQGEHGQLKLDGFFERGFLKLKSPLHSKITVTPALGDSLFEDIVPLLKGTFSAEHPIQIVVDPENFQFPVQNWTPKNVRVERSVLNFGKLQIKPKGALIETLQLLRVKADQNTPIEVWFTPIYMQMRDGVAHISRFDILIDQQIPIAIWGTVDFIKDRVQMTLGLSAEALSRSFGLKKLPKGYMMQLPIRGTTSDVHIDQAKSAAKVGALIAQLKSTPQGALIGNILDVLGGGLTEKKPPRPTTNPLPWAKNSVDPVNETPSPKKALQKEAIKLIDKLLK